MTDLKTVITDALEVEADYFEGKAGTRNTLFYGADLDAVATAVRDHFLDREKVREILSLAFDHTAISARGDDLDFVVDRLIEGLAGKASA